MADDGALRVGDTWVKRHRSAWKYARELDFVRHVAARVGAIPPLLAASDERCELVYGHVGGRPGGGEDHLAAGMWLARLHALDGVPEDPVPLADAMRARWDRWWPMAVPALSGPQRRKLVSWFEPVPGERRWCHRDYREANWLVGEDIGGVMVSFVVIDFEHAGPDGPLADLAKLAPRWRSDPASEDAFRVGYPQWDPVALRSWVALWIVGTVGWARRHGTAPFDALELLAPKRRSR